MDISKLIASLTWFNLVEKLKEILKNFSDSQLPIPPEDGILYGIKDGEYEEIPEGGGGIQSVTGDAVDNTDPLNPVIDIPAGGGIQSVTGEAVDNNDPLNPIINGVAEVSGTAVNNADPKYPVIDKQDLQDVLIEGKITDQEISFRDVTVGSPVDFATANFDAFSVLKNIGNPSPDGMRLMYNRLVKIIFGDLFEYTFPDESGEVKLSKYKVYTALLTQTGTGNPSATVLENTLGQTVTWTRTDVGQYETNDLGLDSTTDVSNMSDSTYQLIYYQGNGAPTDIWYYKTQWISGGQLFLDTTGLEGNYLPETYYDGKLTNTFVEIRVYN